MTPEDAWIYVQTLKTSTMATKRGKRYAVYVPHHPKCNNRGYILRSRYVVELVLDRYLLTDEEVHHINGDREDDKYENLSIHTKSSHSLEHKFWLLGGTPRILDYDAIKELHDLGLGRTKIANKLGYKSYAVKSALKRIMKSHS